MKPHLETHPCHVASQAVVTVLVAYWYRLWREQLLQARVQTPWAEVSASDSGMWKVATDEFCVPASCKANGEEKDLKEITYAQIQKNTPTLSISLFLSL
jgi:hypothetical protein